jgi:hypothetical protein
MALLKWTDGDTITERSANNKGIRKGTEAEIAAILTADNELGDVVYNSTTGFVQVQTGGGATDKRGNINTLIGADSTVVTVIGTVATQVKDLDYIKNSAGFKGNQLSIVARIKTSNAGTTAHLRVRTDSGVSDDLDLTTTSTSFVIVTGTIDITAKADGYHTIEFFMDDGSGDTITLDALEVYGI